MKPEDTNDCAYEHDEHDHGICLDCGEDIMDRLIMKAESASEEDR
jgi:hypothetical protein